MHSAVRAHLQVPGLSAAFVVVLWTAGVLWEWTSWIRAEEPDAMSRMRPKSMVQGMSPLPWVPFCFPCFFVYLAIGFESPALAHRWEPAQALNSDVSHALA